MNYIFDRDWETNPDKVRVIPNYFFRVFYAALDVLKNTKRKKVTSNPNTIKEYKQLSVVKLKKTPLALNKKFPILSKSVSYISKNMRHPSGSGYSHMGSSQFIQCGVHGCEYCTEHTKQLASKESILTVPYPYVNVETYDMSFPNQTDELTDDEIKESGELYDTLQSLKKEVSLSLISDNHITESSAQLFAKLCYEGQKTKQKLWTPDHTAIGEKIFGKLTTQQQLLHISHMTKMKEEEVNGEEE